MTRFSAPFSSTSVLTTTYRSRERPRSTVSRSSSKTCYPDLSTQKTRSKPNSVFTDLWSTTWNNMLWMDTLIVSTKPSSASWCAHSTLVTLTSSQTKSNTINSLNVFSIASSTKTPKKLISMSLGIWSREAVSNSRKVNSKTLSDGISEAKKQSLWKSSNYLPLETASKSSTKRSEII